MKSGLEDRNNVVMDANNPALPSSVSMKSGLEDRNNETGVLVRRTSLVVSMKSGLEDRNNQKRKWKLSRRRSPSQ